jgi:peptidoglycan/xylan/chitin deacetylase (PgdA/CDA1 family)
MSHRRQQKSRKLLTTRQIPVYIFFIFLAIFLATSIIIILQQTTDKHFGQGLFLSQNKIVPTPIILPMLTPLVTPTSTPENASTTLSGFCLNVPVLMYHHIQPMAQAIKNGQTSLTVDTGVFDSQMQYLQSRGYKTISADALSDALIQKHSLSEKSIVVTIDDGYSDIYSDAFPIAKKYNILLNLMIPTGLLNNSGYMTWNNINEMIGSGNATVVNHTWSHFQLTRGDQVKQQMEIITAKKQIQDNLGGQNTIIAYPYGSFNETTFGILQNNGFKAAFTTIPGYTQCDSIIYALRRIRIGNNSLSNYGL